MFSTIKTLLRRAGAELPEDRSIRGLPVTLVNTRPDIDSEHVFARLDAALGLIEQYQPWHFRRLARDFARIQVRRFPCRGAYFPEHEKLPRRADVRRQSGVHADPGRGDDPP